MLLFRRSWAGTLCPHVACTSEGPPSYPAEHPSATRSLAPLKPLPRPGPWPFGDPALNTAPPSSRRRCCGIRPSGRCARLLTSAQFQPRPPNWHPPSQPFALGTHSAHLALKQPTDPQTAIGLLECPAPLHVVDCGSLGNTLTQRLAHLARLRLTFRSSRNGHRLIVSRILTSRCPFGLTQTLGLAPGAPKTHFALFPSELMRNALPSCGLHL